MNIVLSGTRAYEDNGDMLPWLNKHVLDFLLTQNLMNWDVLEWGSGYSTLWWQKNANTITSIEHSEKWFKLLCEKGIQDNCFYIRRNLHKRKDCDYVQAINIFPERTYDCIIVDGRNRVLCIKQALSYLKKDGFIILDNSERKKYNEGINLLNKKFSLFLKSDVDKENGVNPYCWETTVWINDK